MTALPTSNGYANLYIFSHVLGGIWTLPVRYILGLIPKILGFAAPVCSSTFGFNNLQHLN